MTWYPCKGCGGMIYTARPNTRCDACGADPVTRRPRGGRSGDERRRRAKTEPGPVAKDGLIHSTPGIKPPPPPDPPPRPPYGTRHYQPLRGHPPSEVNGGLPSLGKGYS